MPTAVRYGAYKVGLLPWEDRAAFEKLHRDFVTEFSPTGPLEEDIVLTMTRIVWRKNHMEIVRAGQRAWNRYRQIESRQESEMTSRSVDFSCEPSLEAKEALDKVVEKEAREKLGDDYKFIEAGNDATVDGMMENFEVENRLDSMLDGCLKRFLHLRGFKSLSSSTSAAPLLPRPDSDKTE
jgi:hypothetical protein